MLFIVQEEFPSVNGSDQFYQLHTDALFSALIPFSENSNANSVDAKYLSFLTEKLKCGYDKWKSSFDKKVVGLCNFNTLNESFNF